MSERTSYDNAMRQQVFQVPQLVESEFAAVKQRVEALVEQLDIGQIRQVLITGCGDSFCAGLCAQQAFVKIAGLPARTDTAINFSRYYPCTLLHQELPSTLFIGISNSGRVPRVAEAMSRFDQCGALTLALTANEGSPLALAAKHCLSTKIPPFAQSPGVRGYVIAMLTFFLLAIRLGERRGVITLPQGLQWEANIRQLFEDLKTSLPFYDETAFQMAKKYSHCASCEWIGTGHGYGSAVFAREKMYEAAGIPSAVCDSEEWFHSFKFLKEQDSTPVMVFLGNQAAGDSRTRELLERMTLMERDFALVSDENSAGAFPFCLPKTPDILLPLAEFAPPALLACYVAAIRQEPYSRGFQGRWRDFEGAPSTVTSKLELW